MASLLALRGPSAGKDFPLAQECALGRSLGSDIYIGDLNVSRRHAHIRAVGSGAYEIEDLGSGNGTFVNEVPVVRQVLQHEDIIRIGGSSFRYQLGQKPKWSDQVLTVLADAVSLGGPLGSAVLDAPEGGSAFPAGVAQFPDTDVRRLSTGVRAVLPGDGRPTPFSGLTEERAVEMLEAMCAVADTIATELDLPRLLDKILDYLFDVFPQSERGFILLVNPSTGQLVPEAVKRREGQGGDGLQFSRTMVNQVMELRQGVIRGSKVAAAGSQPRDESAAEGAGVAGDGTPAASGEPQMGAPLTCRGESLGTVHLEAAAGSRPFTQEGLALLQAIARQAAAAIASARAGQALLSQQRLEDDLRLAREIQRRFLPQTLHQVRGLRFDTHYAPANQVGGDFYDIIPVGASLVAVLIGDISGHGVSSALLMAKLATDIRIHACMARSPGEVLTIANQALTEAGHEAMFATVLFLLVDLEAQTLTLANAGHQPPLVISERFEGVAELEEATAVALGVVPGMDYPQKVYELKPGDVVLLYTDGINEAKNRQGHDFGMDRLLSVLAQGPPEPSALVTRVMADVRRFVGGAPQSDDQTLVAFGLAPAG